MADHAHPPHVMGGQNQNQNYHFTLKTRLTKRGLHVGGAVAAQHIVFGVLRNKLAD